MEINRSISGVQESIQQQPTSGVEETSRNIQNSAAGEQEQSSSRSRPELDAGTSWSQPALPRTLSSTSVSLSAGYTGNLTEVFYSFTKNTNLDFSKYKSFLELKKKK